MSPRKVRQVSNLLGGKSAAFAQNQLQFQSKRAAGALLKLLQSGLDAAHKNYSLALKDLRISSFRVDEGPALKRFRPRAFGRVGAIKKRTSNVTLVLEAGVKPRLKKEVSAVKPAEKDLEIPEFRGEVSGSSEKVPVKPFLEPKEIKPKSKGFDIGRRIFRRKAIG